MAKIIRRIWKSRGPLGERVKHVAYGYTLMGPNGRERKASSDWLTEQDALTALTARLAAIESGQIDRPTERTFGQVATEYLAYKAAKRSVASDTRILEGRLLPAFGKDLNVRRLTAPAIAQYEKRRLGQVSPYTVANELGPPAPVAAGEALGVSDGRAGDHAAEEA
jgi:hypothetical protein